MVQSQLFFLGARDGYKEEGVGGGSHAMVLIFQIIVGNGTFRVILTLMVIGKPNNYPLTIPIE
jgi:hypothetical protein